MRKIDYFRETAIINGMFFPSINKNADLLPDLKQHIQDYVKSQYDPNNPVASVAALITPGVLFMLGLPWWVDVIYIVMEQLGFDWKNFFATIGSAIKGLLTKDVIDKKTSVDPSHVDEIVNSAIDQHTESISDTATVDMSKILSLPKLSASEQDYHYQNAMILKYAAQNFQKNAGIWSSLKGPIVAFLKKVVPWIVKTILISLGFIVVGGAAEMTEEKIGITPASKSIEDENLQVSMNDPSIKLYVNKNIPSKYTDYHPNTVSDVWMMNLPVDQFPQSLIQWAKDIYPKLKDSNITSTDNYNKIVSMVRSRNTKTGLSNITIIPQPFESIKEIVDSFAYDAAKKDNNVA